MNWFYEGRTQRTIFEIGRREPLVSSVKKVQYGWRLNRKLKTYLRSWFVKRSTFSESQFKICTSTQCKFCSVIPQTYYVLTIRDLYCGTLWLSGSSFARTPDKMFRSKSTRAMREEPCSSVSVTAWTRLLSFWSFLTKIFFDSHNFQRWKQFLTYLANSLTLRFWASLIDCPYILLTIN